MKQIKGMQLGAVLAAMLLLSMAFVPAVTAKTEQIKESEMLQYIDIQELYSLVDTYITEHPKATEEQINQYSLSQIRKLYTKYKDNGEITPQISYYGFTLNSEEENLFWENPWKAINACYYGLSAQDETERVFGYNGHNDASDAFRHAYWNTLMVKHIDYTWASRWATAHEEGATGQPAIEKEMDLWNNNKGRIIATDNPNASDSELSNKVIDALNNGLLRKIVNDALAPTP
ncbi:MAG: hypothetical protein WA144_10435 [Candidatus Methanoperedens sp.]